MKLSFRSSILCTATVAGLISLIVALDIPKTIQYAATSVYLAIAAILFACLFSENTMARLTCMRIAYVITAVAVAYAYRTLNGEPVAQIA